MVEWWGTPKWRDEFLDLNAENFQGVWDTEEFRRFILRASQHTCTPDVQAELTRIWYDTDVRGALPSVQAPTLLLTTDDDMLALARSVAAVIPQAEVFSTLNLFADADTFPTALAAIGRFVGRSDRSSVWTQCLQRYCSLTSSAPPRLRRHGGTIDGKS